MSSIQIHNSQQRSSNVLSALTKTSVDFSSKHSWIKHWLKPSKSLGKSGGWTFHTLTGWPRNGWGGCTCNQLANQNKNSLQKPLLEKIFFKSLLETGVSRVESKSAWHTISQKGKIRQLIFGSILQLNRSSTTQT